jgi:hypothetical protein
MDFFDPDNDGDIDRPMDDQSDDGTGQQPVKVTPPAGGQDKGTAGGGEPTGKANVKASLRNRAADALRAIRADDALAELGVVLPFANAGTETSD